MPTDPQAQTRCGGSGEIPTGECRVAMSGPTCMNPDCPPCQTPETELCPSCPDCKQKQVGDEAVELLAEWNAIHELWCWWEDTPTREAKEGRQRQRYAQLTEDTKDTWREGARQQIELVAPILHQQWEEELLSGEAVEAHGAAMWFDVNDHVREQSRAALKAALAATKGGQSHGG